MNAEVRFRFTERIIRRTALRTLQGHFGRLRMAVLLGGVALALLASLISGPVGGINWYSAGLLVVLVLMPIVFWVQVTRRARAVIAKFGEYEVTFRIADEGLHFQTPFATGMQPWRFFVKLRRYRDFWLLYRSAVAVEALPADQLAQEVRDFIIAKVKENGGKVK